MLDIELTFMMGCGADGRCYWESSGICWFPVPVIDLKEHDCYEIMRGIVMTEIEISNADGAKLLE